MALKGKILPEPYIAGPKREGIPFSGMIKFKLLSM